MRITNKKNRMYNKTQKLTALIKANIKDLTEIAVGQVFYSKYYGNIVATKVEHLSDGKYSIIK